MEGNSVNVPECFASQEDFYAALISYAIVPTRLLDILDIEKWETFLSIHNIGSDCSAENLRDVFSECILPFIYECELNDEQQKLIPLLKMHPHLLETESGFDELTSIGNYDERYKTSLNVDYRIKHTDEDYTTNVIEETNFAMDTTREHPDPPHTLIDLHDFGTPEVKEKATTHVFSLLSAIFSTDLEFTLSVQIDNEELHQRLDLAVEEYSLESALPENLMLSVAEFKEKLSSKRKYVDAFVALGNQRNYTRL